MELMKKLWSLLIPKEKFSAAFLFIVILFQGTIEAVGLGTILPLMMLLSNPEKALANEYIRTFYEFSGVQNNRDFMLLACGVVFCIFLLKNLYILFCDFMQARFCLHLQTRLSTLVLKKYMMREYPFFFHANTAVLVRHVYNEVFDLCQGVVLFMLIFLAEVLVLTAILGFLMFTYPIYTLVLIGVLGVVFSAIYFGLHSRLRNTGKSAQKFADMQSKVANEALSGIKDIKIKGVERFFLDSYQKSNLENARLMIRYRMLSNSPRLMLEVLAVSGLLGLVAYSLLRDGGLSEMIPLIGLYGVVSYRVIPSLARILGASANIRFKSASIQLVGGVVLDSGSQEFSANSHEPKLELREKIEIDGVSFFYNEENRKVLKNLSLTIQKGESIGIVGGSGAGKSTLVDLILGLLEPTSGKIQIDHTPLTRSNRRKWQNNIGYVAQSIYLTDDTLKSNIALGVEPQSIDLDRVKRCLEISQLADFVRGLPKGLDTVVGERGVQISGGQRQRVGIARALYHDPEVLIFDEATSALDNVTEEQFAEAISLFSKTKTMIVIAHRLTTVKKCDRIVVLEDGNIVDQGTFQELANGSQAFQRLLRGYDQDNELAKL